MLFARNAVIEKGLKQISIKKYPYSEKELMAFADSILDNKPMGSRVSITKTTPLFTIGDQLFTVNDYITYAQAWRYKSDGSGVRPFDDVMNGFVRFKAEDYYRSHLEDFNSDFRYQMDEFKDGNLFFEIMQQEVWGKAQNDTAALEAYYEKNKSRYNWKQSADAIIFFCGDETSANTLYDKINKNPSSWKTVSEAMGEKVVADSSRYEFDQIPNAAKTPLRAGLVTTPLKNKTDGTVSFAYILKLYPANLSRNYAEAKGLVISDYQAELERQWVAELKKKYPVKIDEKVFQQISK